MIRSAVFVATAALAANTVLAQVPKSERRRFLDSSTVVTDDPRRVPVPAGYNQVQGSIVLRGGRVFDGTGAAARAATVVIDRNHIAAILPAGATGGWPRDARVIDVTGKTVMPGLIDLHTHLDYSEPGMSETRAWNPADGALRGMERLRVYLESGITSIRDVASQGDTPFILKGWVNQGRLVGPRIFAAGSLITGTGGHGAEGELMESRPLPAIRQASGPDDWREAVRENFRRGADLIKIASHFSEDEVRAAVEEAHELGLKVTADAETFYVERAVQAGVDMIEHPLPRSEATIRQMVARGTEADPTIVPYQLIFDLSGGYYGSTSRRFTFSQQANLAMLRRMKEAGVKLGIGTDLVADWFRYLPWPYLEEMRHFVSAGYTVPEVLVIATKTNAEMLDMGERLGTLEPGKLADLIVVDGRPDERIEDLEKVSLVIRDGRVQLENGRVVYPRHAPVPPPSAGARR